MRDPRREEPECPALLVELGGWFDHLAPAELQAVTEQRAVFVTPRLAVVTSTQPSDLARLGGGRLVHELAGACASPVHLPDTVTRRLSGSYALRFHDPHRRLSDVDRRCLISAAWRAHPAPKVDLRHPDHDLHVYVTDDCLWFGELVTTCAPELKESRRRPYARSYEMPPRRARVLVNLSGARPGTRFLDPFCGTGSLVVEAARIGCWAVGSDIEVRSVRGAAVNACFERVGAEFMAADACALPFTNPAPIDAVACDLPYGRSAGRRGTSGRQLYEVTLSRLGDVLDAGGRAVMMSLPEDVPPCAPAGWELSWSCHEEARTVTRSIVVWRRLPGPPRPPRLRP